MSDVWRRSGSFGFTAEEVRAALAVGGDPNVRFHNIRNAPLHEIPWAPVIDDDTDRVELAQREAVDVLIGAGAGVEATNEAGDTPLWLAVRRARRLVTAALISAAADPWRPVKDGRSAGRVALDGPLADLFVALPGAPELTDEERRQQEQADVLIDEYEWITDTHYHLTVGESWGLQVNAISNFFCGAFVSGPDEDEVIRRIGSDPSDCPLLDLDGYQAQTPPAQGSLLWVGTPPGGGVMIYDGNGILPTTEWFCRRVTTPGALLAGVFDHSDAYVHIWRDGTKVASPGPFHDPWSGCPEEAWPARFGDLAHDSLGLPRCLTLMTLLTGTRVDVRWMVTAPKRAVPRPSTRAMTHSPQLIPCRVRADVGRSQRPSW